MYLCAACRTLRKWWAQYMESTSEMNTALQFYESAQDVLSLVRVYCYCAQIEKVCSYYYNRSCKRLIFM